MLVRLGELMYECIIKNTTFFFVIATLLYSVAKVRKMWNVFYYFS